MPKPHASGRSSIARSRKCHERRLAFETLEARRMLTVSQALLNSWFVSGQGEYAQVISAVSGGTTSGPSTTWSGQTTAVLGDVQKVQYSTNGNYVYISTPDLASYVMGPWWMDSTKKTPFINFPKNQNSTYRIALNTTYPSTTHSATTNGPVGLAVNGVVFFNNGDAFSYSHSSGADANNGNGIFNRQAEYGESATFDQGNGHQPGNGQYHYHTDPPALRAQLNDNISYVGSTDFFPYDPMAYYLTRGEGADGTYLQNTTNLRHSPIIGWMFDGYPIYGPYGYSNPTNPNSAVVRMTPSFSLRTDLTNGSPRITVPGWSAALDSATLGSTAAATAPDALYTMTTAQQSQYAGPAVSTTYPLGRYGEDYVYIPGSGTLDQFNGRWCVTPEFPNGTYAYFDGIDASGNSIFPYLMGRQYYGQTNGSGSVTSISESVTTSFNVATNTAPVVYGPGSVSVAHGGTFSFTGGNLLSINDVDAAAVESITLTASVGTLSVDRSGILAGRTSITAGGNNGSTMTLSGAISELNAALATLTYTAPSSGASATFTARANDGSSSNNLSSTLSTAITLSNIAPTVAGPAAASVQHNGVLSFSGSGNQFAVSDPDSASETVTMSVSAGVLNVTAGQTTVAGAGSSSLSISGGLANVNTALASLTYTAPSVGSTATLSVQANDGSAANNLSNVLTTTIALNAIPTSLGFSAAVSGVYGGAGTLAATLTAGGLALSNRSIVFSLNGLPVGTATTDSTGLATLANVSIVGRTAGTYTNYVGAAFAADGTYSASSALTNLVVTAAPPVTVPDSYTAVQGTALTVSAATGVLANDSDPESFTLSAALVSGPTHGSLSLAGDGSFSYTAVAGYVGLDSFVYQASNGSVNSAATTVAVTDTAAALAWTGAASGVWNDTGWTGGTSLLASPNAASAVTIGTASIVTIAGSQAAYSLNVSGGATLSFASGATLAVGTDVTVSGGVISGGTVSANGFQLTDATVSANLAGGGRLTTDGAVTLSGSNSYTGGTVAASGTLIIGAGALPLGTSLSIGNGAVVTLAATEGGGTVTIASGIAVTSESTTGASGGSESSLAGQTALARLRRARSALHETQSATVLPAPVVDVSAKAPAPSPTTSIAVTPGATVPCHSSSSQAQALPTPIAAQPGRLAKQAPLLDGLFAIPASSSAPGMLPSGDERSPAAMPPAHATGPAGRGSKIELNPFNPDIVLSATLNWSGADEVHCDAIDGALTDYAGIEEPLRALADCDARLRTATPWQRGTA